MKNKFLIGFALISSSLFGQTDILDARNNYAIGQTVTVKGVCTNGAELGVIRYLQDATGAIAAYGNSVSTYLRGDSISVTGVLVDYNGLLELTPISASSLFQNVGIPAAVATPIPLVNESIEARLIKIENVTFVETGSFVGNTNYTISNGTNTLQVRTTNGTNLVGTAIPTTPITLTGIVGQYLTSYQILPRDLNDIVAFVAPEQEINVKVSGTTVLTGGTIAIGNTASTSVTVENSGVGNLSVTAANFTGTDAANFSSSLTSLTVASGATGTFNILYTPVGNGSRTAQINIVSDDADENPYIINIEAVGVNGIASEPSASPTSLIISNNQAYTHTLNFSASASAQKYIILMKKGSAPTDTPVDQVSYLRGDYIGSSKVVANGIETAAVPKGIRANRNYFYAVYAYNGAPGTENYLTSNPATGNTTSAGANVGTYYAGISSTNSNLISLLTAKINPHTVITYPAYKSTVMTNFEIQDTTAGQSFVTCVYSGERKLFTGPFDWTDAGYSREHSYAHSWMPTFDASSLPEYSDQHNLFPTNLAKANTPRSNFPLGIVSGAISSQYLEGKLGAGSNGQLVYEPRNEQKGNSARAIFYMAVAYHGINGNDWRIPTNQDQEILKTWHFADAPDSYEIARHELMFANQGNRNPFIDSANYVCYINFSNMTYDADGCNVGVNENKLDAKNVAIFPNPTDNILYVQVNGTQINEFSIVDLQGRTILNKKGLNIPFETLNLKEFKTGSYIIHIETPLGNTQKQFVVE